MIGNELNPINTSTNIDDVATRDNINIVLDKVTSDTFLTPYIGLERVSKALAYYHIFLPKMTFLEEERGYKLFKASQFGDKMGMTNDGQVVINDNPDYSVYFEWNKNDDGVYNIFCQIADQNEVSELVSDFEDDVEEDYNEDEDEEDNEELDEQNSSFKVGGHPVDPMMAGFIEGKRRKPKTVLVVVKKPKTKAGKKAKKGGGGVFRLPKRKYDPNKYDPVSEEKQNERSHDVQRAAARLIGRRSLDEISDALKSRYVQRALNPRSATSISNLASQGGSAQGMEIADAEIQNRDPNLRASQKLLKKAKRRSEIVMGVWDKLSKKAHNTQNEEIENIDEVLNKSDPASKWISDFVKSDDPKFEGKSKKERIKMALGAYYAAQRNEEAEQIDEASWHQQKAGVNPQHPDSWVVHHNPPGKNASSILFKKKEETEAHIKAQKEAGRGEHLYLLPPRNPRKSMSESARKTFADYAAQRNEEAEQIDEISDEMRLRYVAAAKENIKKKLKPAEAAATKKFMGTGDKKDRKEIGKIYGKIDRRKDYINSALRRMHEKD